MSEVREGLICPFCMEDMGTIGELQAHFEQTHETTESSNEALNTFKEMFNKAKRKLLKEDAQTISNVEATPSYYQYVIEQAPEQTEPGMMVTHSDTFRRLRSQRIERYTAQINKLIIRLSKLLASDTPIGNDKKRRVFEKQIVAWVDESAVSLCPQCAQSFNALLGRRKHHCRLCGGVTCHDCSRFVDNQFAQQLLEGQIGGNIPIMELRCCRDCFVLLERKHLMLQEELHKDHLQEAYTKMRDMMDRIVAFNSQYVHAIDCLHTGEGSFTDAQDLRGMILKLSEKVETISRRIGESAQNNNSEDSLSPRQVQLRALIRNASTQFVKDIIISIPDLPDPAELERQAQARRQEARRRITEKQETAVFVETTVVEGGWSPAVAVTSNADSGGQDPLIEQINIIKGYLVQAERAGRHDEVHMLTENLRQLQMAARMASQ